MTNWRNFQAADVFLEARTFFVGSNASGKSNLLDALRFLAEVAHPGSGGLQAALATRGGFSSIRCLQARSPSYVEIDAYIGTSEAPEIWRYVLRVNVTKREKLATVVSEEIVQDGRSVKKRSRSDQDDALVFSQTYLEQVVENKDFRELSSFLSSCRYLHVVPQIVRDRSRARAEGDDPYGGDLLRRMKETPQKTRLPRLRRIAEALKIAVPQFGDIELKDDSDGIPHLFASYVHWRLNASKQPESAFSDGTLRLIGLLWSISEKGGPLLLEEPELSLNDAVVSELPRMFTRMQQLSGRQIITTTHSSSLLDDSNIGLKEVHRIYVDQRGSRVETLSDNPAISAQVGGGMTISQAVLPLLRPKGIEKLGRLNVAA
ncbi:MAG: ATP-binding protein [Acetobacteraceae bacterium]